MGLAKGGIFGRTILVLPVSGLGFGLGGGVGLGEADGVDLGEAFCLRLGLAEGDVGVPVFVMVEEDCLMLASSLSEVWICEKRQRGDHHIEEDRGKRNGEFDR